MENTKQPKFSCATDINKKMIEIACYVQFGIIRADIYIEKLSVEKETGIQSSKKRCDLVDSASNQGKQNPFVVARCVSLQWQ